MSILASFLYFDLWFFADKRYSDEVLIEGQIEEFDTSSYRTEILLKTESIDGNSAERHKLIVYVDKNEYYGFSIGTHVELTGRIEAFSSGTDFDAKSYYTARGISGVVNEVSDFRITDVGEYPLSYKITDFRNSIARRIIFNSDKDTGGLFCALLLGAKEYLPKGTKLDFSRIGISHILALSGMHLAILAIGLTKLIMFFGVNKKRATVFTIIFTVLYMILTGLSVSVMRAGIMLIISSLLFLLERTRDSMTSLFLSVTLICIFEPYAVFDISLWLSAFATLGIVVFSEYNSEKYHKASFFRWIYTSFISSLFAISATFAITTLKFNGLSILAPLSTFIFSILVEIFVYVGLVLLMLGSLVPVKVIFIQIGNVILDLASLISNIKFVYVSTNFAVIRILSAIFTVLFFAFIILKIKNKRIAVISLAGVLTLIFCFSAVLTYVRENNTSLTYLQNSNDHVVISEDGEILAVDIATYKRSTAYSFYNDTSSDNITRIDKYVVTGYSKKLCDSVEALTEIILIDEIYLPTPQNKDEELILKLVNNYLSDMDISLHTYLPEEAIRVGKTAFIPLYNSVISETKKTLFTVLHKDEFYTYLSPSMLDGKTKIMASEIIAGSRAIILGRHNSGNIVEFLQEFDNLREIVFHTDSVGFDEESYFFYMGNGTRMTDNVRKRLLYVE
jgi:ComEC/Rec2-related protein